MIRTVPFVAALLAVATTTVGQPADVTIDGVFDEWRDRTPVYTDPQDQPGGGIDFGRLWADNDDRFVYLSIEVGVDEISLQNGESITMYLDTDHDPTTGQPIAGIGAELIWVFGSRTGVFISPSASIAIDHDTIQLITAPTITSDQFELSLDLHADPFRLGLLFPSDTVDVAFEATGGGDSLPDPGMRASFVIDRAVTERPYSYDLDREDDSDLRVLSWNVERDGFFEDRRTNAYRRILNAVIPDIIGFTEIQQHSVQQTLDRLESLLPSGPGEQWYGAGSTWDVVVASRRPLLRSFNLINGSAGGYIIDALDRIGSELLLVVAHPRCCEADLIRQAQIDEIMAFVRDSKADGTLAPNTPMVIAGDMNFVGDSRQPKTLTDGEIVNARFGPTFDPDWDGTSLTDAVPLTTGVPATYTWPGRGSDFSPGRLDYIVFSDFVLEIGNTYSLHTPTIPFAELRQLGLSASDAIVASDHLAVVADFRARTVTSTDPTSLLPSGGLEILGAYPNPTHGQVTLKFISQSTRAHQITVFDVLGREVHRAEYMPRNTGHNATRLSMQGLPSGLYFIEVRSGSQSSIRAATVKAD